MNARYTILTIDDLGSPAAEFLAFGPKVERFAKGPPTARLELAELGRDEVRKLREHPRVVGVAPSIPLTLVAPVDHAASPLTGGAWGVDAVGASASSRAGRGVTVAILDTGIDRHHAAFSGVELEERDFTGEGNGDEDGHGTHCAGTVFGRDIDDRRIGTARGVTKALIGKVIGVNGGSSEALFQALKWAIDGADVVSMSLGFDIPGYVEWLVQERGYPLDAATSTALVDFAANLRMFDAIMEISRVQDGFGFNGGAVVVAAAGNESVAPRYRIASSLPAAAEGVLSVGALARAPRGMIVAPFSNTMVDVCAPGVSILSARAGGGMTWLSGTSMATPHVAGVAALWWEQLRSGATPASARNVIAKLLATARTAPLDADVKLADRGAGLVTAPE